MVLVAAIAVEMLIDVIVVVAHRAPIAAASVAGGSWRAVQASQYLTELVPYSSTAESTVRGCKSAQRMGRIMVWRGVADTRIV